MPMAIGAAFATVLLATIAEARVVRLHIERRSTVLNGKLFGLAGAYEKLSGKVEFVLDPAAPQKAGIVDLKLAPPNASGGVEFTADFYVLKPVDVARGNGRILYEVGNPGIKAMLRPFQKAGPARSYFRGGVWRWRALVSGQF